MVGSIQIEKVIRNLSIEDSSLLFAHFLSQLVFHARTTHLFKSRENEINSIYDWMLKKLAIDLSECDEEKQLLSLHWLYDCEVYSNCKLHMDLAEMDSDSRIKCKLYNEVINAIEIDSIKISYSRDISKYLDIYLKAIDYAYGEKAEKNSWAE